MSESEPFLTTETVEEERTRVRHVFALLCSVGIIIAYADRGNMALSIVPMAEEYRWSMVEKGSVLSGFFYGYVVTQVLSGWAADLFGGVNLAFSGMVVCCAGILCIPFAASRGVWALFLCRAVLGVFEGLVFPVFHSMVCRWIPPCERSFTVSLFTASMQLGMIFSNILSPLSIESSLGWRGVFFVSGAVGLVWAGVWLFFMTNTPREHRSVSEKEAVYIEREIRRQEKGDETEVQDYLCGCTMLDAFDTDPRGIPWRGVFSSGVFWAVLATQFFNSWCMFVFQQWLPTYYRAVFQTDAFATGLSVVLPYSVQCCVALCVGYFGERVVQQARRRTLLRRVAQVCAMCIPASLLLVVVLCPASYTVSLCVFTVCIAANALSIIGVQVAHMEIGPRYGGVLFGIINTVCILAGLVGVKTSGWILEATGRWDVVWGVCCLSFAAGALVWGCFYRAELLFS
ncbi:MAG: major facilitator superfamily transporter [Amphiamblys sp. WSBS2006]|nr:MAG: major facilitator superfamily transporter [Amphiamblys sp. WSBS2006]